MIGIVGPIFSRSCVKPCAREMANSKSNDNRLFVIVFSAGVIMPGDLRKFTCIMMIVVSCHKIWHTPVSFSIVELFFPQKVYFVRAE